MIIIAERINSSRKEVFEALIKKDTAYFQNMAKLQQESGADYIDINCATMMDEEPKAIAWLVEVVQGVTKLPICIDSPSPKAIEEALKVSNVNAIINSITLEIKRYEEILPLVKKYDASVIALAMDENGIPQSASERVAIASKIFKIVTSDYAIDKSKLYIDAIIQPISTDPGQGRIFLETLNGLRELGLKSVCGLSNISFGLPKRPILNQTFLAMAVSSGLDSAILDCLNKDLMRTLRAAEALTGKDMYCANYLAAFRKGLL